MTSETVVPTPAIVEASPQEASACGLAFKYRLDPRRPNAPLLFLVHGRAGNFDVMWTFRRAIPETWNVIAPQAPIAESPALGGFSWWQVVEGTRGEPAAIASAAGLLERFMLNARGYFGLQPTTLCALGFSQGAGLLSIVLQRPHQPFDAVGLLAGFVIKAEVPSEVRACPILMCHGERDEVVPFDLALRGAEHLRSLGFPVEVASDPVGHKIGPAGVRALSAFLSKTTQI